MLRIAICDDNEEQISLLRELLGEWSDGKSFALVIDEYISAESFLFAYPDNPCDLILLDIEMKKLNGMELARKLRKENDMLPIIFITGYPDHMGEGYEVEALHYLLKPVDKERLFAVLDRYTKKHTSGNDIILTCEDRTIHISADMITYCEAVGKKTHVHLSEGETLVCIKGIGELGNLLTGGFVSCHRSYIVNLRFVDCIGKTEVCMDNGEKIPLSRRLYKEVNDEFIKFYTDRA